MRSSDRIEVLAVLLAVVAVVLAIPVAGAVGTAVYSSRGAAYAAQLQARHTTTATVLEDGAAVVRPYNVTFAAHARWQDHAVTHEGTFGWDRPVKAGEQLRIWVNDKGDYVGPPPRAERAAADGISAGAVLWLTVVTLAAATVGLVRFRLDRRRHTQWDQGLRALIDGGGRTNSEH
ncbi:hypothetical protein BayCH28_09050 [Mycolicibacterium sp. CH28]|uniref:Rv1733c family protein n=1 Tax=Mycolicibacterium sp. CH28 TaxID=2512237 RepID=UPI001103AD7D|nr:hypothetical protein [Mycolicibacterium sp. CH28]TGD87947.1 hypothetical protein BayCH28_09050 [Mycolicibacterium sp. CH28]